MILFLTLVVVCLFLLKCVTLSRKHNKEPPALLGRLPILGHLHRIIFTDNLFKFMQEISAECVKNGGVSILDLGIRKVCVVTDPEDCLTVANTCLEKDKLYLLSRTFLGQGLITSDVPIWKKHRKLLNPAFSQPVLNSFVGTFNSQARALVKMLAEGLGQPIDHEELLRINNLETICMTTMGINHKKYDGFQKKYVVLLDEMLCLLTKRFQQFWLQSDFIFNMTKYKKREAEILSTMRKLSNEIIEIKRANMKNNNKLGTTENSSGKVKPFMDLILELANETECFTDEEIREEVDNIIVAGHDTTASVLTFVLTLLGSYPDIQEKVYDEIQDILGNADEDLDKSDLSKLIYTEAVLKETLRLYPVGATNGRHSDEPVKLKNYTIEANMGYFLMWYAVNRDPMWGPDADLFRPERWLETDTLPDLNYFAGFSLGRRNCIGKVYAMMLMKVVVAHVVRRYRISADVTKMELVWDVMTRPHGSGHNITLQLRE